jgi:signal transduction histidine kinase/DNA-binding response OmpR family regulator
MPNRETNDVFGDLVRDSLRNLFPVTVAVIWLCPAFIAIFKEDRLVLTWALFAIVLALTGLSHHFSAQYVHLSAGIYLVGLALAVSGMTLILRDYTTEFLYILVVLVAAILTNPATTWGISLLCIATAYMMTTVIGDAQLRDILLPDLFILATTGIAHMSTHRLFTALDWALHMTDEARKSALEAQRHRGEAQQVLKNLDQAYVHLERINAELLLARQAAEKAYEFKAIFVANVSHELRMPLNLIIGFSEMMATAPESYGGVQMPKEYRADVLAIYRSARHLSDLINDVLDLSQIESGRMPLEREVENLADIVREAVDVMRGLAEARQLRLEIDLPQDLPSLHLDRTRIRQVLLNLLTNAARFTDSGWIRVRAHLENQDVVVTVEDSGRGIPAAKISKAFEEFSQLHQNPDHEGSGLGLALSKKFIALHGGKMWIDSEVGRGTIVGFTLPIRQDETDLLTSPLYRTTALAPLNQPTVALLHDDPRTLSLLRRYIEGYQFVPADTPEKIAQVQQQSLPVAVLIDNEWLSEHGFSREELRLPANASVVTCPLPGKRRLASGVGSFDYLTKPVTRQDLLSAIARLPCAPERVLVVDDDPNIVLMLGRMLKAGNPATQVFEAFSGSQALEITSSQHPDLVLLDLLMPEMNGYEYLHEVSRNDQIAATPVIIISARGLEEEALPITGELRLGREAGFSITEVLSLVQVLLDALTRSAATALTSAAVTLEDQPGSPVS